MRFCNNFSKLTDSKKCILAMDTRPSSHMIHEVASASLMECGIDVYDLGIAPTPVSFRESRKYQSGLMITSSHNPLEWNGYRNSQCLVILEWNTPDNTIGCLRKNTNGWRALFPRN